MLVGRGRWLDVVRDGLAGIGAGLPVVDIALRLLLEGDLEELVLVEVFAVARHPGDPSAVRRSCSPSELIRSEGDSSSPLG